MLVINGRVLWYVYERVLSDSYWSLFLKYGGRRKVDGELLTTLAKRCAYFTVQEWLRGVRVSPYIQRALRCDGDGNAKQ